VAIDPHAADAADLPSLESAADPLRPEAGRSPAQAEHLTHPATPGDADGPGDPSGKHYEPL
jgi:hypothetical protein